MWPFYIIIGAFLLVFILFDYMKNRSFYKKASCIPGPRAYPIIGNVNLFLGKSIRTDAILEKILDICEKYPSPCRFWIGNHIFIQISEPEQMKTVLMSPKTLSKSKYYQLAHHWLGNGLILSPINVWKVHRKIIQPTFSTKILQSFFETFKKHSTILVETVLAKYQGNEFDVMKSISDCTINIISEGALGISVTWTKERNNLYIEASKRAFIAMVSRAFQLWYHPDFIFRLSPLGKDFYKSVEYMHSITDDVIRRRKQEFQTDKKKKGNTFLTLLLELEEEKLTEKDIRDQVSTMIIAGNDTTANALSFCLLMLASHPEIQDRVYEELYEIYGDDNSDNNPVKLDDLPRMIYLERVLKESLRLFPASPFIMREVTEDIKVGEYVFPKNASIMLVISKLHRDEKIWPNPLIFNPDRFLPEEVAKRHPYSFVPFSAGPRNCIAITYAMMSMKVILTTILRNCVIRKDKIVPVKDIKLCFDVVLKPVDPIMIRFEKRITNK